MRRTSTWLACAALCACGAVEEAPSGGTSGTPTGPSAPAAPSPSAPKAPEREGSVSVHTTGDSVTASAAFGPKPEAGMPLTEGCVFLEDATAGAKRQGESDSAGIIDLGVVLATEPNDLQIEFDAERKNYQSIALGADGHASGTIRFRARGGAVPAFDADIEAIPPAQLLAPAKGAAITAGDLPVSWTYDGPDRATIVYFSSLASDVRCYVPKGREVVIPAALVSKLVASQGDLRLFVTAVATKWIEAGDYRISVSHNTSTWVELARE